jgi:pilus assembly protein CpaF
MEEVRGRIHRKLLDRLNLSNLDGLSREEASDAIRPEIQNLLTREGVALNQTERDKLTQQVLDEIFGLGPLEPLMEDPDVSDILVNTYDQVMVEREGQARAHPQVRFRDDRHLLQIIDRIVSAVGRRIDDSSPMVDARLPDGSRVNAIIPPLALDGPHLSIRKFKRDTLAGEDLIRYRSPDRAHAGVPAGRGPGAAQRPGLRRHGRREDHAAQHPVVLHLAQRSGSSPSRTRPSSSSASRTWCGWRPAGEHRGEGEVTQRLLLINSLRMRPDRIIVGEVRGGEAVDMLQAMNTGHDGSITTLHANTPRDALSRLETMISMANLRLPEKAMRQQIAAAIDVVIQVSRLSDGTRKVTSISEIVGMEGEVITMQDIFVFERQGVGPDGEVLGRFRPPGSGLASPTGSRRTASTWASCSSRTPSAGSREEEGPLRPLTGDGYERSEDWS